MGCLTVQIQRVDKTECDIALIDKIVSSITNTCAHAVSTYAYETSLNTEVFDTTAHVRSDYSLICAVIPVGDYLEVSPVEVQWITDDIGVLYNVKSNVEWTIE